MPPPEAPPEIATTPDIAYWPETAPPFWPEDCALESCETEETAAETIAPPGTNGAAMAAPLATAEAPVSRPAFTRSPKSDFGVCRSMERLVEMRTGVGSMRLTDMDI